MIFTSLSPIIVPELFLACVAMLLLLVGAYQRGHEKKGFIFKIAIGSLLLASWLVTQVGFEKEVAYHGLYISDGFSIFIKVLILIAVVFILIMSLDYTKIKERLSFEYPVLVLLSVTGMMIMVSANNLMLVYMGLELQSLALYVLTTMDRRSDKASEAGLKYFMLGALASGILLFGASFIYGFAGTLDFTSLAQQYTGQEALDPVPTGLLLGVILVFIGICFKLSAVPFHMWTPDVYEGAPKPVTAFLASAPKIAAIALFIRFSMQPFAGLGEEWQQIIMFISAASMLVGAFGALRQTNIKRLMAYSSIGHMGYMLLGLATVTQAGIHAMLVYSVIYIMMNIGVFACILLMRRCNEHIEEINDLTGVAKTYPFYAVILSILMFSMSGIPPLAGFFGKWFVFQAALESGLYILAVIGVLTSVVAAYYYIRIVKIMYFDTPMDIFQQPMDTEISTAMKFVLSIAGLFNLFFFLYPTPLLDAAKLATQSLF